MVDRTTKCRKKLITKWSWHVKIYRLSYHTRYRAATTKLRTSSYILEIERVRYTVPGTPINDRLCCACKLVEDEAYFLSIGEQYKYSIKPFYKKMAYRYNCLTAVSDHEKYIFLLTNDYPYIWAWLGKYISCLFCQRFWNNAEHDMITILLFIYFIYIYPVFWYRSITPCKKYRYICSLLRIFACRCAQEHIFFMCEYNIHMVAS